MQKVKAKERNKKIKIDSKKTVEANRNVTLGVLKVKSWNTQFHTCVASQRFELVGGISFEWASMYVADNTELLQMRAGLVKW